MKRLSTLLGIISLCVILTGMAGFLVIWSQDRGYDNESMVYVDTLLPSVLHAAGESTLRQHLAPEVRKEKSEPELSKAFVTIAGLGSFKTLNSRDGEARITYKNGATKTVTAEYQVQAAFEKGAADVQLSLVKHDGRWFVAGFFVTPAIG
jgi:hypothetical protein